MITMSDCAISRCFVFHCSNTIVLCLVFLAYFIFNNLRILQDHQRRDIGIHPQDIQDTLQVTKVHQVTQDRYFIFSFLLRSDFILVP